MKHRFRVSEHALEVVATLRRELGAHVRLLDVTAGYLHAHVRTCVWLTFGHRASFPPPSPGRHALSRPVNRRWRVQLTRAGFFDARAAELLAWASAALAYELPAELPEARAAAPLSPPPRGGSSGPAELGVPVAWARGPHA